MNGSLKIFLVMASFSVVHVAISVYYFGWIFLLFLRSKVILNKCIRFLKLFEMHCVSLKAANFFDFLFSFVAGSLNNLSIIIVRKIEC